MAYNRRYNPDALPAHAEPEQAAQMLSQQQQPSSRPRPDERYATKPPPPAPIQDLRNDSYGRPPPQDPYNRPPPNDPYRGSSPRYQGPPPPQQRPHAASNASQHNYSYSAPGVSTTPHPPGAYGSPPPQNYGHGPPPAAHGRPTLPQQQRPPTAAPRGGDSDRAALWPLFKAVDKDGSGHLSEPELRSALVNGDWTSFDAHTVRMMIRMFDTDRSGTIDFDEFCGLWGFLSAWRGLFDRFDKDRSGDIGYDEFREAVISFGYRLSDRFVGLLFGTYERERGRGLSFDLFVQACISLKRMTDVFKKYDDDRDGYITLSFEEFLTEILRQR